MRHPERAINDEKTIEAILTRALIGRIATVNRMGYPVIKPVNFLYTGGKIYIHSSLKGEKIRDIQRGSPVCFEVDEPIAYVKASKIACKANYYYRSVIIQGKAVLVREKERKRELLEGIMKKYQPEGDYGEVSGKILLKTAIIEILPKKITGKKNLG